MAMRRNGTIIIQGQTGGEEHVAEEIKKASEIEQYLNDKVALDVFKKFGVLIRVHLR
jgi:hypothetical protein